MLAIELWGALHVVGVAFAAGAVATGILKYLSQSLPLKLAALGWLANNDPAATMHSQYLLIDNALFGSNPLSVKRNPLFIAVFALFFTTLWQFFKLDDVVQWPWLERGHLYSEVYFFAWTRWPLACFTLAIIGFLICHISLYLFEAITLRWWDFRDNLSKYALLLVLGYLVCFALACALGVVVGAVAWPDRNATFFEALANSFALCIEFIKDEFRTQDYDDLGFIILVVKTGIGGTIFICFAAIIIVTVVNMLYALGLALLRIDIAIRNFYKYDQDAMANDPISYIAMAVGLLVFLVTLIGELGFASIRCYCILTSSCERTM